MHDDINRPATSAIITLMRSELHSLDHAASAAKKRDKIAHPGTYNANPLSAAAAVTALSLVRDEDLAEKANRTAAELRAALRQVLIEESVLWGIYGQSSTFLIYPNPYGDQEGRGLAEIGRAHV